MSWIYRGEEFNPDSIDKKELYGFVYIITNLSNNRKYIGKKFFWSKRAKKLVESDWRKYYGSNKNLKTEVLSEGKDNYHREILHLCKTKSECAYLEAYEQFKCNAILDETYYNDWLSCRVTRKHLMKVIESIKEKIA